MNLLATAAALCCAVPELLAQQLVADINQQPPPQPPSSSPRGFVANEGLVAFAAVTASTGLEPWVSDGSIAGTRMLRDLVPGSAGSQAQVLGVFQGDFVIRGSLPGAGVTLFLSDGTPAGTREVPYLGIPQPMNNLQLANLPNGKVILSTNTGSFLTDFTVAGTEAVPTLTYFTPGVQIGNLLVGTGASPSLDLWVTDGTAQGTRLLDPGYRIGSRPEFVAYHGRAYTVEWRAGANPWLASTDGTTAVQRHVNLGQHWATTTGPLRRSGSRLLYFRPNSQPLGTELLVVEMPSFTLTQPVLPCRDLGEPVEHNGEVYFRATTANEGYELWRSDGTAQGTNLVADLRPGTAGVHPEQLRSTPQGLFFRGIQPHGRRLFRAVSANVVEDLGGIPTAALSTQDYAVLNGNLLFNAMDNTGGELWFGGVSAPPARLLDINRAAPGIIALPATTAVALRERLFFLCRTTGSMAGLWATDGSSNGTQRVTPEEFRNDATRSLAFWRDRVAYATNSKAALTAGTTISEVLLGNLGGGTRSAMLRSRDDQIYYASYLGQLFRSDGLANQATPVFGQAANTSIADFRVLPQAVIYQSGADNLWRLDGASPQQMLATGVLRLVGEFANRVVYCTESGLFATDGSSTASTQLASANFTFSSALSATANNRAYLVDVTGRIWSTDGTAANTRVVAQRPAAFVSLRELIATDRELYLLAETAAHGRELWHVDQHSGQVQLVVDLAPGLTSGVVLATPLGIGDLLFVAGGTLDTGVEFYLSDGTASGTVLVADLHPGPDSSNPRLVGIADQTVYFTADDGVHGNELWQIPLAQLGAAHRQDYGFGSLGSAGEPRLGQTEVPRLGTPGHALAARSTRGFAPVLLGVANEMAAVPFAGAQLLLGGTIVAQFAAANAAGEARFPLPIPASPAFLGVRLCTQAFALDALATAGFATSQGLLFAVGR